MKTLNTKTLAAFAIAAAFSFGNAHAMNTTTIPLSNLSGVTSSDLRVQIEDGVAYLTGTVGSGVESAIAEAYVMKLEGVNAVSNRIFN